MRIDLQLRLASWWLIPQELACFIRSMARLVREEWRSLFRNSCLRLSSRLQQWVVVVSRHFFVVQSVLQAEALLVFNEWIFRWICNLRLSPR